MTQSILDRIIPDGPFSISDLELELVTHHGYTFERATVPRDRVGDLLLGEGLAGRTNFRVDVRPGSRQVYRGKREGLGWGVRVGCGKPPPS